MSNMMRRCLECDSPNTKINGKGFLECLKCNCEFVNPNRIKVGIKE